MGWVKDISVNIYFFKFNNRNTRKRCEICSKLTINTPERRHWRHSGVFVVNFEHVLHLFLVFLLFTLNKQILPGCCPYSFIETFGQKNFGWNELALGNWTRQCDMFLPFPFVFKCYILYHFNFVVSMTWSNTVINKYMFF